VFSSTINHKTAIILETSPSSGSKKSVGIFPNISSICLSKSQASEKRSISLTKISSNDKNGVEILSIGTIIYFLILVNQLIDLKTDATRIINDQA